MILAFSLLILRTILFVTIHPSWMGGNPQILGGNRLPLPQVRETLVPVKSEISVSQADVSKRSVFDVVPKGTWEVCISL